MKKPAFHILILAVGYIAGLSGCAGFGTSRWAMDDEIYAEKYDKPYPSNDGKKIARMIKQSADACFVADRGGHYFGVAGADEPTSAGIELGLFQYLGPAVESRIGLKGLAGTGAREWYAGVDLGLRTQSPSRLAPFAGIGTFVGGNGNHVAAEDDRLDNDDDGSIDERGEVRDDPHFMASVYPELGVHWWLNSSTRLTTSAQYHLTTDGRDSDFWFIGFSLSFLNAPEKFAPLED